jgi:hypothetical protein
MTTDPGWEASTEGDLDPELTEEAGYGAWDPPEREWWPVLLRVSIVLVLVAFLVSSALIVVF